MAGPPLLATSLLVVSLAECPARAGAQWVERPGSGWVQVALYHHDTRKEFGSDGTVEPLFAGGHAVTTSVFLTAAAGVARGVDVWVQWPFHSLVFTDLAARRDKVGSGDPKLWIRVGPELFGRPATLPIALRAGIKFALGDFPVDAEVIPLTEGQRDYEVMLELGHSFWPRPAWAMGWVGYRWRERNREIDRKPGDELFAFAMLGGRASGLSLKLSGEALVGRPPRLLGLAVANARRELYQVGATAGWRVGAGEVEVGARLPVAGRNLPAGPALTVAYFLDWGR